MFKLIDKTLEDLIAFLERVFKIEEYSDKDGFLQRCNLHITFTGLIGLLIVTILTHDIFNILFLYLTSLILAITSHINIKNYLLRTWSFIPLFTFIIALPSALNIITPGDKLLGIGFKDMYFTYQGIYYVIFFTFRVATTISYIILTLNVIGLSGVENILNKLKVPPIITNLLTMTYRYIFLLLHTSHEMLFSIKSRITRETTWRENIRIGSNLLGSIFVKTWHTGELVYLSMLSRGYYGETKSLTWNNPSKLDYKQIPYILLFSMLYLIAFIIEVILHG